MVKPTALYAFGKRVKNAQLAGRILMHACGQDIALTEEEQTIAAMIEEDSAWMDEAIEERREKERARKKEYRSKAEIATAPAEPRNDETAAPQCPAMSRNVPQCPGDNTGHRGFRNVPQCPGDNTGHRGFRNVPHLTTELPTEHPIYHNIPNTDRGGVGEDSGSDSVDLDLKKSIARAQVLIQREGLPAVQGLPFMVSALAVTGESTTGRLWKNYETKLGERVCKAELEAFVAELQAGEVVENRGAALNKRLGARLKLISQ